MGLKSTDTSRGWCLAGVLARGLHTHPLRVQRMRDATMAPHACTYFCVYLQSTVAEPVRIGGLHVVFPGD